MQGTSAYPQQLEKPGSNYADLESEQIIAHSNVYDCSAAIKAAFIRKVYGILSIQLLLTVAVSATFMFVDSAREYALSSMGIMYTALFLPFGILFALMCYKDKHPINMYLLGAFTLCESYTIGVVCARYYEAGYGMIVLQALLLTAAVFVSLTSYVFVTKKDFSWMGGGLYMVLMVMVMWSLMNLIFPVTFGGFGHTIFSLGGALLFSGYILYDTSNIMHHMGPDDYIMAAISLYLDIINLFLFLLEILRMLQGGDN